MWYTTCGIFRILLLTGDVTIRRMCLLFWISLWLFLLFSANLVHFRSPYENYIAAVKNGNASPPSFVNLFKSRPIPHSHQSKTLNNSIVGDLNFKNGTDFNDSNVTYLMLRNANTTPNASVQHYNVSFNESDNIMTLLNQNSSDKVVMSTSKQARDYKDHDLLNNITKDLNKSEFELEERLLTIPRDLVHANKAIEILDDEVNIPLIHEDIIIPTDINDLNNKAASFNDEHLAKLVKQEMDVIDNVTIIGNLNKSPNEHNSSNEPKELRNSSENNLQSSGPDLISLNQIEKSNRLVNETSAIHLKESEFNKTVDSVNNQTILSSLIYQNGNHDEEKTASILTPEIANNGPTKKYTMIDITATDKTSTTVDRFIVDTNCSRRDTGVEDILCMKRPQFLSDYLNPCWYQRGHLKCLPYFHIIGVCKTGTTDLFKRLSHHPQILKNRGLLGKETWYWTWRRYGHCNFYRSTTRLTTFGNFIDHFDARAVGLVTRNMINGTLYHPAVTGHGDPMDFWDHSSWKRIPQNDPSADVPEVNTPRLIKHVNPDVKLILILRDPIERLFSNYLHGPFGSTANDFHKDVLTSLKLLDDCTRNRTLKSCLYDEQIIRGLKVPISGSFYSVHIKEWLKVFPRQQIYIIRTQDLAKNIADTLLGIFRFLQLDPLPTKDLYRVANMPHYYNTKARETAGNIRAETRDILRQLFKPYNTELASILHDEKFNFNYVS